LSGDKAFSAFLRDEVKQEKADMLELPQMSGNWQVKFAGADCTLSSQVEGDS